MKSLFNERNRYSVRKVFISSTIIKYNIVSIFSADQKYFLLYQKSAEFGRYSIELVINSYS